MLSARAYSLLSAYWAAACMRAFVSAPGGGGSAFDEADAAGTPVASDAVDAAVLPLPLLNSFGSWKAPSTISPSTTIPTQKIFALNRRDGRRRMGFASAIVWAAA